MVLTLVKICFRALAWFTEEQFLDAIGRQQLPDHLRKELAEHLPDERTPLLPESWLEHESHHMNLPWLLWPAKRGDQLVVERMINTGGASRHVEALEQATMYGRSTIARLVLTDLVLITRQLRRISEVEIPGFWKSAEELLKSAHDDQLLLSLLEEALDVPRIGDSLTETLCTSEHSLELLLDMTDDLDVEWSMLKYNDKLVLPTSERCHLTQCRAVTEDRVDIVTWLLQRGVTAPSALINAIARQNVELAGLLLPHTRLLASFSDSNCIVVDPAMLELLLDWIHTETQYIFLVNMVATGGDVRLMDRVLSLGLRSPRAMETAIQTGNVEMLELLLRFQRLDGVNPPVVTERVGRAVNAGKDPSPPLQHVPFNVGMPPRAHLGVDIPPDAHPLEDEVPDRIAGGLLPFGGTKGRGELCNLIQNGGHDRSVYHARLEPLPAPLPAVPSKPHPLEFSPLIWLNMRVKNAADSCMIACLYYQAEIVECLADHLSPSCLILLVHNMPALNDDVPEHHQRLSACYRIVSLLAKAEVSIGEMIYRVDDPTATTLRLALVAASKGHTALANWLLDRRGNAVPTLDLAEAPFCTGEICHDMNEQDDVVFGWALGKACDAATLKWLLRLLDLLCPLDGNRLSKMNNMRRQVKICNSALLLTTRYGGKDVVERITLLVNSGADVIDLALEDMPQACSPEEFRWLAEQAIQQGLEVNWDKVAESAVSANSVHILALINGRFYNHVKLMKLAIEEVHITIIHWLLSESRDWSEAIYHAVEDPWLEMAAFIKSREE